jgi:hypothetical protein
MSEESDRPLRRYRVRVRSPGGKEILSDVVEVASPPRLMAPQWGASEQLAGGKADLSVMAPSRNGQQIAFTVERLEGSVWQFVAGASVKVAGGFARATVQLPKARPAELGTKAQLRFRARTAEGIEIESMPSQLSAPLPEGHAPVTPVLHDPEWLNSHDDAAAKFHHGDQLGMRIRAEGLEGRRVIFFVEHLHGHQWGPYATVETKVEKGFAVAELHAHHPGHGVQADEHLDPAELRFRAWLG